MSKLRKNITLIAGIGTALLYAVIAVFSCNERLSGILHAGFGFEAAEIVLSILAAVTIYMAFKAMTDKVNSGAAKAILFVLGVLASAAVVFWLNRTLMCISVNYTAVTAPEANIPQSEKNVLTWLAFTGLRYYGKYLIYGAVFYIAAFAAEALIGEKEDEM